MQTRNIKIAYIGGGSKQWARIFMNDLALTQGLAGEIALYDTDREAALLNKRIGERINALPETISRWEYSVYATLEGALQNADFVIISILPGTFEEMESDVHAPEQLGIYQSVGDTAGPGGILRAMRTVPLFEGFAREIARHCPEAWVLNLTNPMSICVKALYGAFPQIKAFGCCHEVFHAQDFLCAVIQEICGVPRPNRREIYTDASGVNHFTWITQAQYGDLDILSLLPEFIERFFEQGYCERKGVGLQDYQTDVFRSGNKVKMDLYRRYGALGAAGDRHLAEFMNGRWYMQSPEHVKAWGFHLTDVGFRKRRQNERIQESVASAEGKMPVRLQQSDEELIDLIKAILGMGTVVSNVNLPNSGQMPGLPLGSIVETNCVFSHNSVKPVAAKRLPAAAHALVMRACLNIESAYEGIVKRDLDRIFAAFMDQPLCAPLSLSDGRTLFRKMIENTRPFLEPYYRLDA